MCGGSNLRKIFFAVFLVIFFIPYSTNFAFWFVCKKNICTATNLVIQPKLISKKNPKSDKQNQSRQEIKNRKTIQAMNNLRPQNKIKVCPQLENYVKGVVAAEMPVSFHIEALKAQAVAARTYAIKHYDGKDYKNLYQAYISVEDMKKNWGSNFDSNYKKICRAVDETAGQTIKYNQEMIEAVFHSTSAGVTENSENVWSKSLPYLKSVDSQDDQNAPNFLCQKKIPLAEAVQKINSHFNTNLLEKNFMSDILVLQRTKAGYIKYLSICGKKIDAMEFRMLLGLRSTNFVYEIDGKNVVFTTKGFGHGAGMSQYGANFMAQRGCDYKQILKHYYSGVEIE